MTSRRSAKDIAANRHATAERSAAVQIDQAQQALDYGARAGQQGVAYAVDFAAQRPTVRLELQGEVWGSIPTFALIVYEPDMLNKCTKRQLIDLVATLIGTRESVIGVADSFRERMTKQQERYRGEINMLSAGISEAVEQRQARTEEAAILRRMARALLDATSPDYDAPDVE